MEYIGGDGIGALSKTGFLDEYCSGTTARAKPRSIVKPWAGRVYFLLSSLSLPHVLSDPQTVDIETVVKQLQRRYVDEVIGSTKV